MDFRCRAAAHFQCVFAYSYRRLAELTRQACSMRHINDAGTPSAPSLLRSVLFPRPFRRQLLSTELAHVTRQLELIAR
jgi:hypothetical protein